MRKTVRIFALGLTLLLLTACGAQPPSVSELPGAGTENVSASTAPEARYVYKELGLPEDTFISKAIELADGNFSLWELDTGTGTGENLVDYIDPRPS